MRQYRKYALLLLCAGAFAAGMTGCKKKDSSLARVQKAGELKVAVYKQDTDSEELCSRVADALGVTAAYTETQTQEDALQLVSAGQADLAVGEIVETQPLDNGLSVSQPYRSQDWYVVTARGDYSGSVAGFQGRILALTRELPDEAFRWSGDVGNVNFVGVESDKVQAALDQDAVDGYVCLEQEAVRLADESAKVQMQRLYGVSPLGYAAALRDTDRQLADAVNEAAQQMQNDEPESADDEAGDLEAEAEDTEE